MHSLYPRLIVSHVDTVIATYVKVFGAKLIERFADSEGRIVHAAMSVEDGVFSLAESVPAWGLRDPLALGGSPCLLLLEREDPDATAQAMVQAGGEVRVPIADRAWGKREGRVADPFGHLWILSRSIEDVSAEEIARRLRG
jgi:uncharacterized glyoxalase superfamily protein PhnB